MKHLVQALDRLGADLQALARAPRRRAHAPEPTTQVLVARVQQELAALRQAVTERRVPRSGPRSEIVGMRVRRDGQLEVHSRLLIPLQ